MLTLLLAFLLLPQASRPPTPRVLELLELPTHPVLMRGSRTINIDGSLHEWPKNMPGFVLNDPRQLSGTAHQSWLGKKDLSMSGTVLWDEKALIFAFTVVDDWPRAISRRRFPVGGQFPPGDCLHLFFDPRRDTRRYGPDPGRREDREYWFGMTGSGETFCLALNRKSGKRYATKARRKVLYSREQKGYSIELAIPWEEILGKGIKPKKGMAIDFQIIFNDFDDPNDRLPQTRLGWTFGSSPRPNPAVYGTLVLTGPSWTSKRPPKAGPRPNTDANRLLDNSYWSSLLENITALPPKAGKEAIAGKRGELLRALDRHMAAYPRLDYEQFLILQQRRMRREFAGYMASGIPYFLKESMNKILRRLETPYQGKTPALIKLPGRGFLIRSKVGLIALSPAGPFDRPGELALRLDAVFYARVIDNLDRHDPLSFRMMAMEKPVLFHVAFHLPGLRMPIGKEDIVHIGDEKILGLGIKAKIMGVKEKIVGGKEKRSLVSTASGIRLTWPSGFTLVYPSLAMKPEQIELTKEDEGIDLLILDPDHPYALDFITKWRPKKIVLEGFLDAARFAPVTGNYPRAHRMSEFEELLESYGEDAKRLFILAPAQELR